MAEKSKAEGAKPAPKKTAKPNEPAGRDTRPTAIAQTCRMEKCKRPYRAKGYCGVHYKAWRHGELPKKRYKICHHEACRKPMTHGGLCEEHHKAARGEAAS